MEQKIGVRHPPVTKVKEGLDIRQLVKDKYGAGHENFLLWTLDWSDIDGVLDYLYGVLFTSPTPQPRIKEIIDFIEENCEVDIKNLYGGGKAPRRRRNGKQKKQ